MPVHSKKQAQIGALLFDEASTEILTEYVDYNDVFLTENAAKFLENTGINKHAIKLEDSKLPPFVSIYSLGSIELKTLKTSIKINLANDFI